MDNKELYRQKMQARLDEMAAEFDKLKAKVAGAGADAQLELNQQIEALQSQMNEAKNKLAELAEAGDDAWESIKGSAEAIWDSMRAAFGDIASKTKE